MDTPNSSPSTFNTDLQLSSVFTLDDLIDSNLLPVLGNDVPELSFTPTSPDSSSSRVNTFLRWPSEENNTLTFLKAAPGLLFGNLSQIDTDVEPTADTQGASAMLKPLSQNLHDQWYGAENVMNTKAANPNGSGFTLSGWSPTDGLFDVVDLPHSQGTNASDRQPLADVTSAYSNKNRNIPSTTRLGNQENSITSTALYSPLYNNSNDPRQLPSEYPKSFGSETNALVFSDVNSGSFDRRSSPPTIPLMRCTPSGRPIGGVPPEFARSVANKVIKKERAKEDAKRAKMVPRDDRYVLQELPTKRNRDCKLGDERNTSDKKSRGEIKNPVDRTSMADFEDIDADFKQAMARFLEIDGVQMKESPSSLVNALGLVLEDSSVVMPDRVAKRVRKRDSEKQGGRSGKRSRL